MRFLSSYEFLLSINSLYYKIKKRKEYFAQELFRFFSLKSKKLEEIFVKM